MSFLQRPGKEEIAAGLAAVVLVSLATLFWLRRESSSDASGERSAPRSLDAELPVDPALRTGTLSNGLRYFVRANTSPKQRAELRLVVNAGSVLEHDDQLGLAHAVEHMLFRGTRHFPRRTVEEYMRSIGMRPGHDINAHTTTDETVFNITVPTDRAGAIDTAMAILADMAHEATFDQAEAHTEAGIVFEEWRSSRGAQSRLTDQRNALLLSGSRYSGHPTIGDTAVLRRFDVGAMRRFYNTWYRPELMAVAVVGDFDERTIEKLITKHFGIIPSNSEPRVRPAIFVPRAHEPRAATLTDVEATGTRVGIWYPRASTSRRTVGDFRRELVDELWRDILNARLEAAAEQPGSPLLSGDVSAVQPVRPLRAELVSAVVMDGGATTAVDQLVGEVARLAQRGPTAHELSVHGDALLKRRRQATDWLDASDDLVEGYVDAFLADEPATDSDTEYELAQEIVPTIRIADLVAAARRMSIERGALVLVTAPDSHSLADVSPAKLVAQARAATARVVDQRTASMDSVTLFRELPTPGTIATEEMLPQIDAVQWTLSNGMHVILKPTEFSHDHIEFRMIGTGGASLASDADYPSAYYSDGVIRSTGVGPVNGTRLARMLDASSIDFSRSVSDEAISFSGSVDPRGLEMFFQVLNLNFTSPRSDTVAFRRYHDRALSFIAHREADPDAVFYDTSAVTTEQHHRRSLHNTGPFIREVSLPKALAFWNARMSNAASFTLVMTGDFSLRQVRPLIARYLASLPRGIREQPRDNGIRFPSATVQREIFVGVGPRAKTQITLSGPFDSSSEANDALDVARDVADLALGDQLRETLGGTYGVSVSTDISSAPPARYRVVIEFEASPQRIDTLANAAIAELQRLASRGPTREQLEKTREAEVRDLDHKLESNDYWADELSWHAHMGWPFSTIMSHQQHARDLTMKDLRDACAKYLQTSRYSRVTMYPRRNDAQ